MPTGIELDKDHQDMLHRLYIWGGMTPEEISNSAVWHPAKVNRVMGEMVDAGLAKEHRGRYSLTLGSYEAIVKE